MSVENIEFLLEKSKNLKVLYVEDDVASRESTLQSLSIFFQEIAVANNGQEGYDTFVKQDIDLIITDINMPVVSGLDMIKKIRELDKTVTILILSADVSAEAFTATIRAGIEGYLLKPIDIEQFIALIRKSVDNIISKREVEDYKVNLEHKLEEQTLKIKDNLFHDSLTKLHNFLKLDEDIASGVYHMLIAFDIAQFTSITMEYGRAFSDKLLISVAKTLQRNINSDMQLYKLELDRFAVLSKESSEEKIEELCQQILAYFDMQEIEIDDKEIAVALHIGVASIVDGGDVIIDVEHALENAKRTGSRSYSVYDRTNDKAIGGENAILSLASTKEIICEDEIVPHYRKIVAIDRNEILSYEVLVEWKLSGELVSYVSFMDSAKKLGLISSITKIIIQKSFQFFKENEYDFYIKITHRDLIEGYLPMFLKQKLELYKIEPSRVTLEILENISISEYSNSLEISMQNIRDLGINLIVYDIGREDSNITNLIDVNINLVKIDAKLVNNMAINIDRDEKAREIVKQINYLSKMIGVKVMAEGVDTKENFDAVKEIGIDYVQGLFVEKTY